MCGLTSPVSIGFGGGARIARMPPLSLRRLTKA
jgi:hypothetical protein